MHRRPSTPQNESGGLGQHVVVKCSCQWHGASNRQRIILEVLVLAFGVCSGVTQAATKQHKGNFRMVDGAQCWRDDTMVPRGLLGWWTQGKTKSRRYRGYVSGECGGQQCKADSGIWRANDAKETEGL